MQFINNEKKVNIPLYRNLDYWVVWLVGDGALTLFKRGVNNDTAH